MFNLEQSITEWREQMLAAGIESPMPLEELEAHLREAIRQQVQSGQAGQMAFEVAARQIGQPELLKGEFRKIERTLMKRISKVATGVVGLLVGGALMVPACIQLRQELIVTDGKLGLMLLGWGLLVWSLGRTIQFKVHKRDSEWEIAEMSFLKHSLKTGAGILGLLTGIALMIPAAIQAGREGRVKFAGLCYFVFGVALLITGMLVAFCPYKRRRA
jgi:hypothetical protein